MLVLKFGGTSVADADAMARVASIVARIDEPQVVIVSALAGVTDRLLEIAALAKTGLEADARRALAALEARHHVVAAVVTSGAGRAEIVDWVARAFRDLETIVHGVVAVKDVPADATDAVAAYGELISSRIVAAALEHAGVRVAWVDAREVIVTDGKPLSAAPLLDETRARLERQVRPRLDERRVPVLGGFIGCSTDGRTTTLGRGGSDCTAAVVGACLGAREIQIWTDVDGILTADPRVVPGARPIPRLSFTEAYELAYHGAKVIHPGAIAPALARGVPVRVLNSARPEFEGTLVTERPSGKTPPVALACKASVALVTLTARPAFRGAPFLRHGFATLQDRRIDTVVAGASETRVVAVVSGPRPLDDLPAALGDGVDVVIDRSVAIVAAVGESIGRDARAIGRVAAALASFDVRAFWAAPSGHSVLAVLPARDANRLLARLHERLFGSAERDVHIAVAGPESTRVADAPQ